MFKNHRGKPYTKIGLRTLPRKDWSICTSHCAKPCVTVLMLTTALSIRITYSHVKSKFKFITMNYKFTTMKYNELQIIRIQRNYNSTTRIQRNTKNYNEIQVTVSNFLKVPELLTWCFFTPWEAICVLLNFDVIYREHF